jgi:hypothetical protein
MFSISMPVTESSIGSVAERSVIPRRFRRAPVTAWSIEFREKRSSL